MLFIMFHGPSLDHQDSNTPLKFYGQIKDNNNNHKTKKKWNSVQKQRSNVRILKGQSHGDFPIFFVTSLINLYQSTLLIHELLLDHKGTILNEFSKEKTSQNEFLNILSET